MCKASLISTVSLNSTQFQWVFLVCVSEVGNQSHIKNVCSPHRGKSIALDSLRQNPSTIPTCTTQWVPNFTKRLPLHLIYIGLPHMISIAKSIPLL